MGFFMSKEEKEKREIAKRAEEERKAKILLDKIEECKRQKEQQELNEKWMEDSVNFGYCDWLNQKTKEFISEINSQGIHPQAGFEIERRQIYLDGIPGIWINEAQRVNGRRIVGLGEVKGLAFDDDSQKIVYFHSPWQSIYYFENNNEDEKKLYEYTILDYSDILSVNVEVDKITTYQSSISNNSMLKRGIVGGVLLGGAGAVIGSTTAQRNTTVSSNPRHVQLFIRTNNPELPLIEFIISNSNIANIFCVSQYTVDTMWSLFSNLEEKFSLSIDKKPIDGKMENIYIYNRLAKGGTANERSSRLKNNEMSIGVRRINDYAQTIERIIKKCDLEYEMNYIRDLKSDKSSITDELKKLGELKENGILTDEEFTTLKMKLINGQQ